MARAISSWLPRGQPAHRFEGFFQKLGHRQSYAVFGLEWKGHAFRHSGFDASHRPGMTEEKIFTQPKQPNAP
jgi:hypothetical protein